MHILIGFIVALGSLFWALNRLQANGVDLNAFNPFTWFRRHKWKQKHGRKAIHSIEHPMEVSAVFIIGIVLLEGEITIEQKDYILSLFESEFGLNSTHAKELYASASYLLKDEIDLSGQVKHILAPSKSVFTREQFESMFMLVNKTAIFESSVSDFQSSLIKSLERELNLIEDVNAKWS